MKLFSLVLMFVVFDLFGLLDKFDPSYTSVIKADLEKYRLYVTDIDQEFHCFALSNNMICTIPKRNWETETLPEVGTEVYLKSDIRLMTNPGEEDEFAVGYSQDPEKKLFSVRIIPESKQYGLSCVSSECILTAPAGWIFSEQYRDVLLLSDGSQWIKDSDGKTVFGPESRLVVSKQKDGGFSIIDLDVISYGCKCRAEKRSGKTLTWHRYERVKPYTPEEITKE